MNIIYSVKDEKFNATRLVEAISDKDFSEWFENLGSQRLFKRFPNCFVVKNKKSRRLAGTYLKNDLIYTLVNWANPTIGNFLTRGENEIANTQGYVYLVKSDEFEKYKIGCCCHPHHKFKFTDIVIAVEVDNMFTPLIKVINEFRNCIHLNVYQAKGRIAWGDESDLKDCFINTNHMKKVLTK
jgi:hypothetical protein